MRITEAADRLGTTPRALRYRERLRLTDPRRSAGSSPSHRRYDEDDLHTVRLGLALEERYAVSPATLAFALRVVSEPEVAADVRRLAERTGRVATPAARAAELERERALRWLGRSGVLPPPRRR